MADAVISAPAVQSTPNGYQVPAAQEITVRSVRAVIDGSGAGSAFLPTLRLRAPTGTIVWQSPTSTTVAAGGSADVSWFPRVGGGAASTGTGTAHWFYAIKSSSFTVHAGATEIVTWTTLKSSDATLFSLANSFGHANDSIVVARAGIVFQEAVFTPSFITNFPLGGYANDAPGPSGGIGGTHWANTFNILGLQGSSAGNPTDTRVTIPIQAPFQIYAQTHNYDASDRTVNQVIMNGFWLSNSTVWS